MGRIFEERKGKIFKYADHKSKLYSEYEKRQEDMNAADVAVEEVECKDGTVTVFAPPVEFYKAKTALLEAFPGLELEVQEITFLPQATKVLSGEDVALFERFLGMLNDCDDVQEIYHNVALPS